MTGTRKIRTIFRSQPTLEGAGVRLRRAFGHAEVPLLDPFLLLDDIHSENPPDYVPGFPWHPHRGIETVTYVINGDVEHGDSIGNHGEIRSGDVQWMTAGSGIIHQEMPQPWTGDMRGLQLWVNLPARHKMMAPRYRDVPHDTIPRVETSDGASIKVIAGHLENVEGPVTDLVQHPRYLDVSLGPSARFALATPADHTVFVYVLSGAGHFGPERSGAASEEHLVVYDIGGDVEIVAGHEGAHFLLVSGKPLGEPVAWRGPIVMNTEAELAQAFAEYRDGSFLRP